MGLKVPAGARRPAKASGRPAQVFGGSVRCHVDHGGAGSPAFIVWDALAYAWRGGRAVL
jgi:hypothetical protein